jgi:hypothetical protein
MLREKSAARELVNRQCLDVLKRHHAVMRISAFLGPGIRIVFEVPWWIGHDHVVAEHRESAELPCRHMMRLALVIVAV